MNLRELRWNSSRILFPRLSKTLELCALVKRAKENQENLFIITDVHSIDSLRT